MSETYILPILGLTLSRVDVERNDNLGDRITFHATDGRKFTMQHYQDCCEVVEIEDICGETGDLVGSPIVLAEEAVNVDDDATRTWTFYRIGTASGMVTIRWCGTSNGYYSERVSFAEATA